MNRNFAPCRSPGCKQFRTSMLRAEMSSQPKMKLLPLSLLSSPCFLNPSV